MIEIVEGILRYKRNKIVSDVHDYHFDLNEIEKRYHEGEYTMEEKYQYFALIGYSVDGLSEKAYQDRAWEKLEKD